MTSGHAALAQACEFESLQAVCDQIAACEVPFEDLAEDVENLAFKECQSIGVEHVVAQLERLSAFFESLPAKNDEIQGDLTDVYVLIGEICQYHNRFEESVEWFGRGVTANDRHSPAFHSLAVSYMQLGDLPHAIRSLEQEIRLTPGNYYSYLLLADLYEKNEQPQLVEETLDRLLERDPDNVQALHRLIIHYQTTQPDTDTELLERRLIAINREYNRAELIIWTFHMCCQRRHADALGYLVKRETVSPDMTIINLLKAHIYGELHNYTQKRTELARFKEKNNGRDSFMANKLKDFEEVFGAQATKRLRLRLAISSPSVQSC